MLESSGISGYDVVFTQAWEERTTNPRSLNKGRERNRKREGFSIFLTDLYYFCTILPILKDRVKVVARTAAGLQCVYNL